MKRKRLSKEKEVARRCNTKKSAPHIAPSNVSGPWCGQTFHGHVVVGSIEHDACMAGEVVELTLHLSDVSRQW